MNQSSDIVVCVSYVYVMSDSLPTALARKLKQSLASVCPSVRLLPLYLSNRLAFELELLCVDHDHNSAWIESQGHFKVKAARLDYWRSNAITPSL